MTNRDDFRDWASANGYSPKRLADEAGVSVDLTERLFYDKTGTDFKPERMNPVYRSRLYNVTKHPMFKMTPAMIAGPKVDVSKLFRWQQELLQWMADNDVSRKEVARRAGIIPSNMNVYCTTPCDPDRLLKKNREALYKVTNLSSLNGAAAVPPAVAAAAPVSVSLDDKLDKLVEAVKFLEQKVSGEQSVVPASDADLVNRTIDALTRLVTAVEHYKTRPEAVELLRQSIPRKDMGYVVAALNGLYSSDDLGAWVLRTSKPIEVGSWKMLR
jgi:hypothetical protein